MDRARRQIKEWESLDNEATDFAKQVNAARRQQQQKVGENVAGDHAVKDEL